MAIRFLARCSRNRPSPNVPLLNYPLPTEPIALFLMGIATFAAFSSAWMALSGSS
ncbi:hypothetical protein [Oscillatoria acuminata]|uniref:hypothetical protein n=1 Tax=Oscillatoria acuminata TaxID=118323 RepID=UPI0003105972|nr:hypothetical protein [Oscillatoria acuminata]